MESHRLRDLAQLRVGILTSWMSQPLASSCLGALANNELRRCWLSAYHGGSIYEMYAIMYLQGLPVQLVALNGTDLGW